MLEVRGICKAFDGRAVLRDVSFVFPGRAVTALVGPSGCGKTTLLNIIMGLLAPDAGTVSLPREARLAAVFQEDRLIEHFCAARNVHLTTPREVSNGEIRSALRVLGLDPADDKRVSRFSGGMRRRVAIARAALFHADIVLLDEPFKGLDEDARRAAAAFLRERCADATVILVSHEREEAALMGAAAELRLRHEEGIQ